MIVDMRYELD